MRHDYRHIDYSRKPDPKIEIKLLIKSVEKLTNRLDNDEEEIKDLKQLKKSLPKRLENIEKRWFHGVKNIVKDLTTPKKHSNNTNGSSSGPVAQIGKNWLYKQQFRNLRNKAYRSYQHKNPHR